MAVSGQKRSMPGESGQEENRRKRLFDGFPPLLYAQGEIQTDMNLTTEVNSRRRE